MSKTGCSMTTHKKKLSKTLSISLEPNRSPTSSQPTHENPHKSNEKTLPAS